MKKFARKLSLLIADIRWYCRQNRRVLVGNPVSPFSVESYKPSFVAKHSHEELEAIRLQEKEELIEELEEIIHSKR